jgi:TonB-dependent SusC/RagA subfamily outer membrane receptor
MNQMRLKVLFSILLSLTLSVSLTTAQKKSKKITVSGYVFDTAYNPVVGAMIFVDNENTLVRTDNSGHYKIRVRPDAVSISVLYQNKQVNAELVGGQTAINFTLGEITDSNKRMQQGGESVESAEIGNGRIDTNNGVPLGKLDVVTLPADENSNYLNIYEMIQSKVPGVDVNGQKIRIRGINTFKENNEPTFVVDGTPVNSIDYIVPNTVQSITVLRGPAAAMYGSRGVNGVIVITLKKSTRKTK